ncbi:tol-pal system protein YbgF [Lutimaribacter sp. EGI FJ00015]|uniref:Tol-pal system protein YbgF n=1 Tax=Lutimaribacter degradans TaxID=2945989 RepID=A0ACC5ZR43_9RHOB|nr:tol-pal system protein YbgF [Lutimaribacter sp. EGI FJ00013]MCM2560595.1 tol-pal system protein YbgF [Lutimaribacter sp. EGI FJ00013]MCO0612462.1 tol-pal system protein YbgF [Lutimaribacter sp. EGI FJ00015]MCO0634419.1 tol-pal system protein YbgF [Lutimaribacter sp. EGI FJ00014]
MRKVLMAGVLAAMLLPGGVARAQQAETLADIRQELTVVFVEIQKLKRELSTTGAPGGTGQGGSTLQRIDAIEAELQRLTAKTEALEFRITSVVRDGTNRIGDLEFRLCELEDDCDIAQLGDTPSLGGVDLETGPTPVPAEEAGDASEGPQLAMGEQGDFDRAMQAMDEGDHEQAAELFGSFVETYPGGPMTAEAHFQRGEALARLDRNTTAARAFLDAFSSDQDGPFAPRALLRLGEKLGDLGQTQEACVTLAEVSARFPQSDAVTQAEEARARLDCP